MATKPTDGQYPEAQTETPHPRWAEVLSRGSLNDGFRVLISVCCSFSEITVLGRPAISRNMEKKLLFVVFL